MKWYLTSLAYPEDPTIDFAPDAGDLRVATAARTRCLSTDSPGWPVRLDWRAVAQVAWREHRALILTIVAYGAVTPVLLVALGQGKHVRPPLFAFDWIVLSGAGLSLLFAFANRRTVPWLSVPRLASVLVVWASIGVGYASFVSNKRALLDLFPHTWDVQLAVADAWIHGGRDPWQWLAPWLTPTTVGTMQWAYFAWYPLQAAVLWWCVWMPSPASHRFLMAYVVTWITLGNLTAGALFSVGPCYYANVVPGRDRFAELWPILDVHATRTRALQDALWKGEFLDQGVAAMPSLHVAIAVLCAWWVWRVNRLLALRCLAILYVVVIQLGSVALGWHYAIDGYVGALGAVVICWGLEHFGHSGRRVA